MDKVRDVVKLLESLGYAVTICLFENHWRVTLTKEVLAVSFMISTDSIGYHKLSLKRPVPCLDGFSQEQQAVWLLLVSAYSTLQPTSPPNNTDLIAFLALGNSQQLTEKMKLPTFKNKLAQLRKATNSLTNPQLVAQAVRNEWL